MWCRCTFLPLSSSSLRIITEITIPDAASGSVFPTWSLIIRWSLLSTFAQHLSHHGELRPFFRQRNSAQYRHLLQQSSRLASHREFGSSNPSAESFTFQKYQHDLEFRRGDRGRIWREIETKLRLCLLQYPSEGVTDTVIDYCIQFVRFISMPASASNQRVQNKEGGILAGFARNSVGWIVYVASVPIADSCEGHH